MRLRKIDMIVIGAVIVIIGFSIYTMLRTDSNDLKREIAIDKVNITSIRVLDEFGFSIKNIRVNQIVLFQVDITNLQNSTQPFICIIKVVGKDDGITYSLTFNKSQLSPNEKISVANSWIPQMVGEYTVYAFVWESLDGEALSSKKSMDIVVMK